MNETLNSPPALCVLFPRCRWLPVAFAARLQIPPDLTLVMEGLVTEGHIPLCSSTHWLPKLSKGLGEVKNQQYKHHISLRSSENPSPPNVQLKRTKPQHRGGAGNEAAPSLSLPLPLTNIVRGTPNARPRQTAN